ncbi:MAG TPA: helix-turn-helix domain-containing protein [Candidatus Saccharimonadales bacterium]|nr:helix-turn-helix domain-containing protein [Candidatus Saccharimonadales bacterium]
MPNDITPMHEYFAKLGLEPEIAEVYLALHAYGPQSVLQLARNAKVERTRLYRLLDTLTEHSLIETETLYKRKLYKAAPIGNLQILLTNREQEIRDLQKELTKLQERYQTSSAHSPLTHVQFYRGEEGVKQMFWNQTKSRSENLSILFENMQMLSNLTFFERWVERCNARDIRFRSIIGDHFLAAQRTWYSKHNNEKLKYWQGCYLPNKIFPITHSMVTYDDVVAYYNWKDGEVFGLEVYNNEIAEAQRHLFEMLWKQGQPITGHGEAETPGRSANPKPQRRED